MEKWTNGRTRLRAFLRDRRSRSCFLATALFGALAYLYFFTNAINNNDLIACLPYGYGATLTSGRWMLYLLAKTVDRIWGHYNVPLFNGVLALGCLALASAVLARVLGLRSARLCFVMTAVTVTVPAVASTMFFAYSIHYYMFALLLMALAAWLLTGRGWLRFGAAVLLAAASLGIYQAYFPFFAVLLLLVLIRRALRPETEAGELLKQALKFLAALAAAYLCYRLLLRLCLLWKHTSLSSYQGVDQMGSIRLSALPSLIWQAYRRFFLLPREDLHAFNATRLVRLAILACFALSVLSLALLCWGRDWKKTALLAVFLVLLPLAANAMLLLAGGSTLYTRMMLGLIAVFYLPLVLVDGGGFRRAELRRGLAAGLAAVLLLVSLNYAWQSNGNYLAEEYANRKAENYFTTLVTRARSLEGYRADMRIVLVGDTIQDSAFFDNWNDTPFFYSARIGAREQINQYSRGVFIANYLGLYLHPITEEEAARYAEQIGQMATYPSDGSLRIVDNLVLVRLE